MSDVDQRSADDRMTGDTSRGMTADMTADMSGDTSRGMTADMPADTTADGRDGDMAGSEQLFGGTDAQSFRERWEHVQSRFVDDPRGAVQEADELVSAVTQSLTSRFAERKGSLEEQWSRGDDVETEDLRNTLRSYRALFERLLAA